MAVSIIATHIRSRNAQSLIADFEYDDGVQERCHVLSPPALANDSEAITYLAARISDRVAGRVRAEINKNMSNIIANGPGAVITLNASTDTENATFIREHYQQAEREEAIAVGAYLNTLTDAQLINAFGITQTQLDNVLRPKISRAATIWADLEAEVGV